MSFFSSCWKALEQYFHPSGQVDDDPLLWHINLTQYATGDFSIAVVQANAHMEDQSQVKDGPYGTIFGVYDGHGGPEASTFIMNCLFSKIEDFAQDLGGMSLDVLKQAFAVTEAEFLSLVDRNWKAKPKIAFVGSCCLVGVISGNKLYVGNLGDSRVVLGTVVQGKVVAQRMLQEHNANNSEVREELQAQHPDDSHIVVNKGGTWRVKGIIQVSRAIGDVFLKEPGLTKYLNTRRYLGRRVILEKPVLSAEPSLHERKLTTDDRFLIFASDGLWEHMTDQEAVDIVQRCSRKGIARHLARTAVAFAAHHYKMSYSYMRKLKAGTRRNFHDDISVVVVYLDHSFMNVSGSGFASTQKSRKVSMDIINAPLNIMPSAYADTTSST